MTSTLTRSRQSETPRIRHARLRWSLAGLITVIGVAFGVAEYSPVLGVRTVTVIGARQVSEQQVLDAAAVKRSTPLLRLDTRAIAARIEKFPAVRTVRVRTSLPSTVTITVTERTPLAYTVLGPSAYQILDQDNVAFRNQAALPGTVPRIDAPSGPPQLDAITVAASLSPALLKAVAAIAVPTTQTITLTLSDGRVVMWGGTDRDADKTRLLPVLLTQPGRYFDVSDPDAVLSRPAA